LPSFPFALVILIVILAIAIAIAIAIVLSSTTVFIFQSPPLFGIFQRDLTLILFCKLARLATNRTYVHLGAARLTSLLSPSEREGKRDRFPFSR
jgi:lipopolysaccharide/colanic/teichoic acid biosynthesis glycosyltransferase